MDGHVTVIITEENKEQTNKEVKIGLKVKVKEGGMRVFVGKITQTNYE